MPQRRSVRFAAAFFALALTAACATAGGVPELTPEQQTAQALAGSWAGTFSATVGDGEIWLTLQEAEETWSGQVTMSLGGDSVDSTVGDITIEGETVSFTAFIEGADVQYRAQITEGTLSGTMVAWANGEEVGNGRFTMTRR